MMKKLTRTDANRVGPRPRDVPERSGGIPLRLNGQPPRPSTDSDATSPAPPPNPALTGEPSLAQPIRMSGTA